MNNGDNGDNWDRAKADLLRSYPPASRGDFPSLYYLVIIICPDCRRLECDFRAKSGKAGRFRDCTLGLSEPSVEE